MNPTPIIVGNDEIRDYKASWQKRVYMPEDLQEITFERICQEIKTSKDLEQIVNQLRAIPEENMQQEYKKDNFPYFNLGQFDKAYRKDSNLLSTSYFIFDYDHLDKIDEMKSNLQVEEAVFAYFVSPRGNGLKVIYRLDKPLTNYKEYSKLYKYYAKIFNVDLGERPDKTSDASRACFFSYDPDLYINTSAVPLTTVVVIEEAEAKKVEKEERLKKRAELISNLSGTTAGKRTPAAMQIICSFIAKGVDKKISLEVLKLWNRQNTPPLSDNKIIYTINDLYKRYEKIAPSLPVKFQESNNSYNKKIKVKEDFVDVMVTSFKMIPKELLVLDNSDCLKCDIVSSQGHNYPDVLIENTDWHTKQKFMKALGHQDCVFLGSDHDLQALCQFIQIMIPVRKTGTKVIGLHGDVWVVDGINITKAGKTDDLQIVPYEKGSDAFYHRINYKTLIDSSYKELYSTFYEYILKVNDTKVILPYIGWFFATPLKSKIEEIFGAFPLLFNHGGAGSGKTSSAKLFARLAGYKDPTPMSVTMKTFPLLKMLSSTNSIPQWYDEFKVSDMKEADVENILRFMRKVYAGEQESKGRADQTIENYKLSAPMVVMGEWNINQPAIMERVILVRSTDAVKKNRDMQHAFQKLEALELEAFMPDYIQYCLTVDVKKLFDIKKEFIINHFEFITVAPRIINNLSVMLVGLELFRQFAQYNMLPVPEIDYETLLDDQLNEITGSNRGMVKSAVDQLMEELSIMADNDGIKSYDYTIATVGGIKTLAIRFNKIFPDFKVYAKKTNYEGDLLDKSSYLKLFDECDYVIKKSWPVKFKDVDQRCLCIDVEKAIKMGINLDGFGYKQLQQVTDEEKLEELLYSN